jgi:ABC-type polysaccharide/polyol phosphate export permease
MRTARGMNGVIGVYYREMRLLRSRLARSAAASMVSPALFLVAFGYGLGRGRVFDGLNYLEYLFVGLLAMSTINACYGIGTDINIARFYLRTFDEFLIAPVARWQIVAGEALSGMTRGAISVAIFAAYAVAARLDLHVTPLFALALGMHMLIFSLLGFCVALAVRKHGDQAAINTFLITPMVFLSGVFFPVEHAPFALRLLVGMLPVSHAVSLMRATLSGGGAAAGDLCVLGGFLIGLCGLAAHLAAKAEG